jgi:hypothetical protein
MLLSVIGEVSDFENEDKIINHRGRDACGVETARPTIQRKRR